MKVIVSHRGNTNGPNPGIENHPSYILEAIGNGFDVEVDLWLWNNDLYLGHNKPDFKIEKDFLSYNYKYLWIHCKNVKAAEYVLNNTRLNAFFHQNDECTITTKGYLWTFPGGLITPKSIAVLPESYELWDIKDAYGVCTDYPLKYK